MGIKYDVIFESSVFRCPRLRESRDIVLASDWLSGSACKETRRENSTDSILEIPHASPHRSQPWRHFPASQPAWQSARLPASDPAWKLASCAAGFNRCWSRCDTFVDKVKGALLYSTASQEHQKQIYQPWKLPHEFNRSPGSTGKQRFSATPWYKITRQRSRFARGLLD